MKAYRAVGLWVLAFLSSACSGLFYQPDSYLHYPPEQFKLTFQEIKFQSGDGTHLRGWYFPSQLPTSKGLIVQFHGNGENMSSHYLSLAWLIKEGYDLWTFDYRGYGQSEGDPDQKGVCLDGIAGLEEGWKLYQKSSPQGVFVVYGQSLGGAVAMRSIDDFNQKEKTSLLVLDSTFYSYRDVARHVLASHWLTWIMSPLGGILVSDQYSAEDALKKNKIPLLVIHDERDPVVPYREGEAIFATSQARAGELTHGATKEFWKLSEGQHIGTFDGESRVAWRKKFLEILAFVHSGAKTGN